MNRTDLDQADLRFVSIEVEVGSYMFLPRRVRTSRSDDDFGIGDDWSDTEESQELPIVHSGKGEQRAESPKGGGDAIGQTVNRIFLYNPLHDYESVWWIAVWLVFYYKPFGVADHVMKKARDAVYEDRTATFLGGHISSACSLLPGVLRPLGEALVDMRDVLADAYRSFERSFDGSRILLVFQDLKRCLKRLMGQARGLDARPPVLKQKVNAEEVRCFDAVALGEEHGRAGRQPMDIDSVQEEGVALGKKTREDSPLMVDRVLRPRTNQQ